MATCGFTSTMTIRELQAHEQATAHDPACPFASTTPPIVYAMPAHTRIVRGHLRGRDGRIVKDSMCSQCRNGEPYDD